ncbi:hypothetical protein PInf_009199 [Phytophthora infestans]|nr:hypothetical protein PInf_009199 [Phytophthora infestans]
MSPGDIVFGKPVMLQTYAGKSLINSEGTKAVLVENGRGEAACVQFVRCDDGSVAIKSMNNKHYLTSDDENDDPFCCRFDACEIKKPQKFRLEFADERAFILMSEEEDCALEHSDDIVVCTHHLKGDPQVSSMLWVLKEPTVVESTSSLCAELGFTGFTPVQEATVFLENTSTNVTQKKGVLDKQKKDELDKRHEAIMKLAMAGRSVDYIDEILLRLTTEKYYFLTRD